MRLIVVYRAMSYEGTEMMAVISGYDPNMRTINSLSDAEDAAYS